MAVKDAMASIASRSGLASGYGLVRRKLTKSQIAILMYHRVCPPKADWPLRGVSPGDFARQLEYFRNNYEILSLRGLQECLRSGEPLPEKAVVITFDDGYRDNYEYALPILKKYAVPATVFLTTGYIGSDELFWWDKVRYMIYHTSVKAIDIDGLARCRLDSNGDRSKAAWNINEGFKEFPDEQKDAYVQQIHEALRVTIPPGLGRELVMDWDHVRMMSKWDISFEAHTVSHPILTNIPLEQAREEMVRSRRDIEENLDREVIAFSYPNGRYNQDLVRLVKEAGFSCAVTIVPRRLVTTEANLHELPRMSVLDFQKFQVMFSGLWGDLSRLNIFARGSGSQKDMGTVCQNEDRQ